MFFFIKFMLHRYIKIYLVYLLTLKKNKDKIIYMFYKKGAD